MAVDAVFLAGMAQRGGVVSSHLRFGPKVLSPQIAPGTADVLLAFEAAEGLRWQHMLRPGAMALVNDSRFVPPIVELGLFDYPDNPVADMKAAGTKVVAFDATTIAQGLGDIRLGNTVMLGAIAAIAGGRKAESPEAADGISIKLSALFSTSLPVSVMEMLSSSLPLSVCALASGASFTGVTSKRSVFGVLSYAPAVSCTLNVTRA